MNKVSLIIKREYLSRVRKKSFIVMTILGPVFIAALFIVPILVSTFGGDGEKRKIAVLNAESQLKQSLEDKENLTFEFVNKPTDKEHITSLLDAGYNAVLYSPDEDSFDYNELVLSAKKQPSMSAVEYINNSLEVQAKNNKLKEKGLDPELLKSLDIQVDINTKLITEGGEEKVSSTTVYMFLGLIAALVIYFMVFTYGSLVMRGVIEEKTNRVIEIIISSVRPFQLIAGKIIGVAFVGLTQLFLWVLLSAALIFTGQAILFSTQDIDQDKLTENVIMADQQEQVQQVQNMGDSQMKEIYLTVLNINWSKFALTFAFFFLGGYLLYTSLFAAIGAAVDNETDTQQFMLPITIPLILSIIVASSIIQNPDSALADWFSLIPFTSPIIMVIRVLFGVSNFKLILSMVLLVITFILTTWIGAKIYRTGILMYGKKPTYKDLWKWLRY